MAELQTVIFDFDGTLHDSMRIYPTAFRAGYQWLVDHGWAYPQTFTDADISGYIGLTAKEMWTSFRPDLPDDVWPQAAAEVGRTMDRLILDGTAQLFPGVPEMLSQVAALDVQLVFLSNCRVAYQDAARKAFGLDRWFAGYYNSEAWHGAPKPQIFEDIARAFPGGYAMVGDRNKDLAVSRVHGFPGIGCLFGYGMRAELSDADYFAETPAEVVDCLRAIKKGTQRVRGSASDGRGIETMTRLSLYCDGGCRGNQSDTNVGGWGALLIWGPHQKELRGGQHNTTNNQMELTAAIEGLRAVKREDIGVDVYVDSAYVYNGITSWIYGWMKKGWKNSKGDAVANKDLWLDLLAEKIRFPDITFNKVKGHADNEGNNRADALANLAMDDLTEGR